MPSSIAWHDGMFNSVPRVEFGGNIPSADRKWLGSSLGEWMPRWSRFSSDKLEFRIDPSITGDEAYRLEVSPHAIELAASSPRGLYWSLQTLRQLRQGDTFPCVSIQDAPAFAWRGVMLDEGRHFMGPKFVRHFLDVLSLYKFNVLHWHLTDDQGWRIEIKSHPELTKVGAWRQEADGSRTGGFYTQAQIKDIVTYAALRNITVVPEIEMPGHSSAAIASLPGVSCTGERIDVPATWGVFGDVLCPGKEQTFSYLGDVLKEVTALFPAKYIHFGGDEVPKGNWHDCPDCQARMKSENLSNEEQLQGYFTARVAKMIAAEDRIPMGWDEILHGGAPQNAVVQIWNDQKIANQAIGNGNEVILSPQSNCYLNRAPADNTLANVYAYDPLQGISDPSKVMGIECTLWSEGITSKNCLLMFLPRGLAMSEIFWSNPKKDFASFQQRVDQHLAFLDSQGIDYGSGNRNLISYKVSPDTTHGTCRLDATLGLTNVDLRYTLDGSAPTVSSPSAIQSIEWPVGKTLRVAPFRKGVEAQDPVSFETTKSLAYGAKISFQTETKDPYRVAGPQGLVDGLLGTGDFHDGIWLGWQGTDLIATCDLGKATPIHEIGLHCLQQMRSWILMPTSVRYEVSEDGSNWQPFGEADNTVKETAEPWITQWFTAKARANARFVRITARNYGKLPAWHNGAGGDAWIFADEMSIH